MHPCLHEQPCDAIQISRTIAVAGAADRRDARSGLGFAVGGIVAKSKCALMIKYRYCYVYQYEPVCRTELINTEDSRRQLYFFGG